jgi:uncharacterized protein (TIGR02145 family)
LKTKVILSLLVGAVMTSVYSQKPTLELTFTAIDSDSYVTLNRIMVMNRTQGGDTVLYYPDTVLVLDYQVGINEASLDKTDLLVFQNYPNPFKDQTTITLYVPENGKVDFMITDLLGRQVIYTGRELDKGYHSFSFTPGIGSLIFFTALWKGHSSSIKLLHSASVSHQAGSLEYIGDDILSPQLKTTDAIQNFSFTLGDVLLYIGYSDTLKSGIIDTPESNETYTFQFATDIPCPGTPTVTYWGQVYNTIQIFSQCWLKENLNAGTMINSNQNQQNNSTLEKYCYNNQPDSCTKYGGLYQWNEMMKYTIQQGAQGYCPSGWHLPTDEEWKLLEGAVDSNYGIGNHEWDIEGEFRGFDAGTNLRSISGWYNNGNGTDLFGFSGLPGGYIANYYSFNNIGYLGYWWSSTEGGNNTAWERSLGYFSPAVYRDISHKNYSFSVRCLRDY